MTFNRFAWHRHFRGVTMPPAAIRVAMALFDRADHTGECWPGIDTLIADTGLSDRGVRNGIDWLKANGFVEKLSRGGRSWDGTTRSTRYRLTFAAGVEGDHSTGTRVPVEDDHSTGTRRSLNRHEKVHSTGTPVPTNRPENRPGGRGTADAAPTTPPRVSRDGEPRGCCAEHEPPGVEGCRECLRAWCKHECWETMHAQSWAEWATEVLSDFRAEWVDQGPPRFCDRDHPVGAPCGACRSLREMRTAWDKRRAQWEVDRTEGREEIARCRLCDDTGHIWVGGDRWWCPHEAEVFNIPLSDFGTVSSVPPSTRNNGSVIGGDTAPVVSGLEC